MKRSILLLMAVCLINQLSAQKDYIIELKQASININNRSFYIDTIIDNRSNKSNIGFIHKGISKTKYSAQLGDDLCASLKKYFDYALPRKQNQQGIGIKINQFEVIEESSFDGDIAKTNVSFDYYYKGTKLASTHQNIELSNVNVTKYHAENIREALHRSMYDFAKNEGLSEAEESSKKVATKDSLWVDPLYEYQSTDIKSPNSSYKTEKDPYASEPENRNIMAVGYQIGGYALVGFNYEIRLANLLGIHFGAGYKGFTTGVKIHTGPRKNSPFFNASLKDGGFGLIKTVGVEFGSRIPLSKESDFGLFFQLGFAHVLNVDYQFAKQISEDLETNTNMLAIGVGFSW